MRLTDAEERMTGRGITNQEDPETAVGDGLSLFWRGRASGDEVGFDLDAGTVTRKAANAFILIGARWPIGRQPRGRIRKDASSSSSSTSSSSCSRLDNLRIPCKCDVPKRERERETDGFPSSSSLLKLTR